MGITEGRLVNATKEVILSAGAVNSPKLLLLSGIGPANDLELRQIPVTKAIPGIGRNFHDHLFLSLVATQKPGAHHRTTYLDSPEALEKARQQYNIDQTGPLSTYYLPQLISHFKSEAILGSEEFHALGVADQKALKATTKPSYEVFSVRRLFEIYVLGYIFQCLHTVKTCVQKTHLAFFLAYHQDE